MKAVAKGRVLEVGSGPGATLATRLAREGMAIVATDVVPQFFAKGPREAGAPPLVVCEGARLPFKAGAFDTVCAFDVLEHLEDDAAALAEWARVAKRALVLSVPSSENDEALGRGGFTLTHWMDRTHFRAYTRASLEAALRAAGFAKVGLDGEYPLHPLDSYLHLTEARQAGAKQGVRRRLARLLARLIRRSLDPEPWVHLNWLATAEK